MYALALAFACGRLGFDPMRAAQVADARPGDAAPDAPSGPPTLTGVAAPGYGSGPIQEDEVRLAAGDFVVAVAYWDQTPDTVTLTDTLGLAWTAGPTEAIGSNCGGGTGNGTGAQLFFATAAAAGSGTVTVTQTSGTQPLGVFVLDYENIGGVDSTASAVAPSSSTAMVAPPVTATDPGVVVAFFGDTIGMGTVATGSEFTELARDDGFPNLVEGAPAAAGDQYVATATLPNGPDACWVVLEAVLRARR
jgi:hypothetical protein